MISISVENPLMANPEIAVKMHTLPHTNEQQLSHLCLCTLRSAYTSKIMKCSSINNEQFYSTDFGNRSSYLSSCQLTLHSSQQSASELSKQFFPVLYKRATPVRSDALVISTLIAYKISMLIYLPFSKRPH